MATVTAAAGSTNWTTAAFGAQAATTNADDVIIPTGASVTITAANNVLCRSLSVTGTGTIIFAATTSQVSIGGTTAGAGNVALSVASGATVTLTGIGAINFVSTSATQQTVTSGGKTLPSVIFNGAGGSWQFQDNLSTSGSLSLTAGTLDTNSKTITIAVQFGITSSTTRTLTLGSSAISLTRSTNTCFDATTSTNLTITANTATITQTTGSTASLILGSVNYNGASLAYTSAAQSVPGITSSGATIKDFTWVGPANKTSTLTIAGTLTCTGAFSWTGNSTTNRSLLSSGTIGTSVTITAASANISNVDLKDVAFAVSGSFTTSSIGDCGGVSGITVTTPVTRYAVVAGNVSNTATWSTSSGGSGGASVPLPQDTVFFNGSSAAGTYTNDMPRWGTDVDFTGFTRTFALNLNMETYGSWAFSSGMTLSGSSGIQFAARTSKTITSAGQTIGTSGVVFQGPGGTWTLQDALNNTGATIHTDGTLNTNGFSFTTTTFTSSGTRTRVLTLGASTINLTSTAATTVWSIAATGLTMNASSATIAISTASAATRVFTGAAFSYGALTYTVANSTGALTFSATYIDTINAGAGRIIQPVSSGSSAIRVFNVNGSPNTGYEYLNLVSTDTVSAPDSAALSITSDLDIRVRVAPDTWTTNLGVFAAKWSSSPNAAYAFTTNATTGGLRFSVGTATGNPVNTAFVNSSVATGFADGAAKWVRVTRRSSDGRIQFFTAPDGSSMPSSWTQLGTNQTLGSTILDTTAPFTIGSTSGVSYNSLPGKYYYVQVRNNVLDDGTGVVFDADLTNKTFGTNTITESSSNAATVTWSGNTAFVSDGRTVVTGSTSGTAAFLELIGPPNKCDYLNVKDVYSSIPGKFYAGANSALISGTTNVVTTALVSGPWIDFIATAVASGSTTTVTLASYQTATAGRLIHLVYGATTAPGTINTPTGYSSDVSSSTTVKQFKKISDGTETGVTMTSSGSPSSVSVYMVFLGGFTGTPTFDVSDTNNSSGVGVTSLNSTASTGPTNTSQPAIALAHFQASGNMGNAVSATNSFQIHRAVTTTQHLVAKLLTSTASVSTTYTWTTNRIAVSVLVIYRDVASATSAQRLLMGVGS